MQQLWYISPSNQESWGWAHLCASGLVGSPFGDVCNPGLVNCQLLTCIQTSSSGHKSLPSGHFFGIKQPQPAKQNLFIQAIFKAARSFLCHKMSGEQILFYQGSPISGLGDEFARCGGWRQINQIEAWMINVTLKREKETSHLLKSFGDRKYLIWFVLTRNLGMFL